METDPSLMNFRSNKSSLQWETEGFMHTSYLNVKSLPGLIDHDKSHSH